MEDVLRIEAAQRADAECIADALAAYDASVEPNGAVVIVAGMGSGTLLTAVLDALKACLECERDRGREGLDRRSALLC